MDRFKFLNLLIFGFLCTFILLNPYSLCIDNTIDPSDANNTLCHEFERQALLKFKHDLTDPTNRLSSWVGEDCCRWAGIVCNNITGHVTKIKLRNPYPYAFEDYVLEYHYVHYLDDYDAYKKQRLGGEINPSLLDLKHLYHLDLSGNHFNYILIPSFIGSVENLRYLNLSSSGFSGKIPHQLGNLSSIRYLDLSGEGLHMELNADNLQWLMGLVSLRYLDMSGVNLRKAMDWVHATSMLPSLRELRLRGCSLADASLPVTSKVNFTSLSIFDLSRNHLPSSIHQLVSSLTRLVSLDISGSKFRGGPIPSALKNMTALRVYRNRGYTGPYTKVPKWFYSLTQLEEIDLYSCGLQGVITNDIGNLTSLVSLNLERNQLEGKVPKSLGKLCNLEELDLSNNNFDGMDIEIFLGSFSRCKVRKLEVLNLRRSNIIGHLPNKLGDFENLRFLSLLSNSISGQIPTSIQKLSQLRYLDLCHNQLNGSLPESIGQLAMLEALCISGNLFEGVVTNLHFVNLNRLRYLRASGNKLTLKLSEGWIPPFQVRDLLLGSWKLGLRFPPWIESQHNLYNLDLSNTGISDFIPSWFWEKTPKLYYLNFSSNQIFGEIPNNRIEFGYDGLIVDLSSNRFTGPLPYHTISTVASLIDLSNNYFSGSIHHFLCEDLPNIREDVDHINLGNNHLSGTIPDCFEKWKSLKILVLENNRLTGSIPNSLGRLHDLRSLHLRNNSISGELPPSLQNCTRLEVVDLSQNLFTGKLPAWLGRSFSDLVALLLRSNRFQGDIPDELCHLQSLQILDLAQNNLSGPIPRCFHNLKGMQEKTEFIFGEMFITGVGVRFCSIISLTDYGVLVTRGTELGYSSTLLLVRGMDLSSNNFTGDFPEGLTRLAGLRLLNLSRNHLTGSIPQNIGDMKSLEYLDFSLNHLSGEIPPSMSSLTFLSYLNLSFNKLTGRIPSSTQIQSMEATSFIGNNLSGPPLPDCRPKKAIPNIEGVDEEGGDSDERIWFLGSIALGYVLGFWVISGPFLFSTSWRTKYFRILDIIWYKLCDVFA